MISRQRKSIVMIGPVYPYKGGIAHYTGLMCKALRDKHDVYMMSYRLQYPKFLYKKTQKDYSNNTFRVADADYQINTVNPLNYIASACKIRKLNPDLIIIQWWHPYFAPCYYVMCSMLKKYPILFLCHNVFPHERFPMDRLLTKLVLKRGNTYIVQSKQDEEDLLSIKRNADYIRTAHPTYNAFRIKGMSKGEARRILRMDHAEYMLLFFGFVREYKGLKHLLRAMHKISEEIPQITLYIVGDFDGDKEEYTALIQKLGIEKHIIIEDGYIPDKEVEKYFAACDLVVLPYETATQSGIAQIAYGFEKPIVVTDVGGLPEIVVPGKTGYVAKAKDSNDIAEKIITFCKDADVEAMRSAIQKESNRYSWETFVCKVEELEGWREST